MTLETWRIYLDLCLFMDEECVNLEVVNDGRELTKKITPKKKSDVSQ